MNPEYYPLDRAAVMVGCAADDLVHLAANKRIIIHALTDGRTIANGIPTQQKFLDRFCAVNATHWRGVEAGFNPKLRTVYSQNFDDQVFNAPFIDAFWDDERDLTGFVLLPDQLEKAEAELGKPKDPQAAPKDTPTEQPTNEGRGKNSQLHAFIWRVYQYLSEQNPPKAQMVWHEIQNRHKDHDNDEIIQEVTAREILWRSSYGNEQKLSRNSFDKTISNIKKSPPV